MSLAGLSMSVKAEPWRDKKPRSLREAAQAACDIAAAEHLPIAATLNGDALRWHAEAMLKTVAVHGTRDGRPGLLAVGGGSALENDLSSLSSGWRDLNIERHDFDSYLEWLRSVW